MSENELRAAHARTVLRDQFAATALTGLLATGADNGARQVIEDESKKRCTTPVRFIAELAYICADAMLERRDQFAKTP